MREYRIQCETDPMPAGQQPIGSAHTPNPVTSSPHDLQGACPLACNGTANNPQSSTVARSHSMELATESLLPRWVCVLVPLGDQLPGPHQVSLKKGGTAEPKLLLASSRPRLAGMSAH